MPRNVVDDDDFQGCVSPWVTRGDGDVIETVWEPECAIQLARMTGRSVRDKNGVVHNW